MSNFRFIKLLLIFALISSCAGPSTQRISIDSEALDAETRLQKKLSLQKIKARYERLQKVGYPILKNSSELCENTINSLGVMFNAYVASDKYSEVEKEDKEKFHKELEKLRVKSDSLKVVYKRQGEERVATFYPDLICNYPILLVQNDSVNAFANGSQIGITTGMIRFAEEDEQLGLVIAHELGHNIMDHISKLRTNSLLGTIVDLAAAYYGVNPQGVFGQAGARMYSQEFEAEADYVGIYYMERAGYSIDNVADFWRDMAVEHPGSINQSHTSTHPATPERFLEINAAIEEIKEKKRLNQQLIPNVSNE